ncbi:MAG: type II secretion system protein [Pseudonocardiales bacterium]
MWHPRRTDDGGFTLVELLVTMVIIGTVLIGLIGVQVSAMRTVAVSKQRQQAVALANQAIEELRALPYLTVSGGLLSTDLAGDPNISAGRLRPTYTSAIDETLVTSNTQSKAPLYPHVQPSASTKVGNTQYDARLYVSLVAADMTQGYWLTSIVSWTSSATSSRPKTVAVRSRLFSPSGCLSTATHPFSGPCQAFLYGNAGRTPAGVSLQAVDAAAPQLFNGIDLVSANISMPSLSAVVQLEQALSAQGKATTSGVQVITLGAPQAIGGRSAASSADTDPSTGAASGTSSDSVAQPGTSQLNFGSGSILNLGLGATDTATSVSTTAAASADNCREAVSGTALATYNVCTSSSVAPGGSLSATYSGQPLATIGPGAPSRASAARFTAPGATRCTAAAGVGCTSAATQQNVGTVTVGSGLPAQLGFTNMVSLTGYSATAVAESGIGAAGPVVTRSGQLTYRGIGQQPSVVTLSPTTSLSAPLGAAVAVSGQLTVGMSGDVRVLPATATSTGAAPCATACSVSVTVPSVSVSVTFDISLSGVRVAYFTLRLDLGSALAKTTYKAAPSG